MSGSVRVVHVVAKAHLDLGFTAPAEEVQHRYVAEWFPRALATAAELRERGGPARLVWTTGSWILDLALDAGTAEQRNAVAVGIRTGDLAWHALPLTTHTELMDAELVRSGLAISQDLDARFARRTTAAKLTDVPGHTRSLVPLLAGAGVTFLHLGVNPAWPVPDVPPVFRWRAPDGTEVVVAYGRGGYGGDVVVPGCPEVLAFLHAGDNGGPPSADEVEAAHAELAVRYPGAEVRASTLDAFARAVDGSPGHAELPVVTAEIGDPWIFGAASDPVKLAAFRLLLRSRRGLPESTRAPARAAIDRSLLLAAEHTWGLDQKEALPDVEAWDRRALAELRRTPAAQRFEASWAEQRAYVDLAAEQLQGAWEGSGALRQPEHHPRRIGRVADVADDVPRWPFGPDGVPLGGFAVLAPDHVVAAAGWELGFDPSSGSLTHLVRSAGGRVLADVAHPLGLLGYQSFAEADYERFFAGLTPGPADEGWARSDNTKPGIDAAGAVSGWWHPRLTGSWHASQRDGTWHTVLLRLAFSGMPVDRFGAPAEAWARWTWTSTSDELDLDLWWVAKPATRLPEATWCSFVPIVQEPNRWVMDKLGQAVSPLDVVRHGGRALHAVGHGLTYDGADGPLRLATYDAALVAPGRPALLDADPPVPDLAAGFHVLLHDNCWGTNFPMWVEGPARFRFTLSLTI